MRPSAPLLDLNDVSFSYGPTPVLQGVSLRLERGQMIALMGGSGSGKTTLLRLIGGQLQPSQGQIRFNGESTLGFNHRQLYAMRKQIGMLFQFGALFTDLSVYDNIAFPLREHFDLPEVMVRDLVLMKLHAVGLRGAARQMPHELSGGMARRVALARAIALDPLLMLYDEPFTGLDPISLGTVAKLIRELNDALGTGAILVTHNVQESLQLVDHVYFLSRGRIVAAGKPADILQENDPFVHQFIHAEPDGPVPFHVPAGDYLSELGLRP
ncbi:ABC transporter ATP-binding protein [Leeia aquatica]|uniref:ABC transporter ATP-binding protein n=1 Tax=Leeia aquatica TaxID=2725557 RepID=UPI00197F01AF|nr:ABC transporter ATP-binding protein [Leeia aquatica]